MKLVSIKIVAELLMVKESTIYSWVHNGTIPFHKLNGLIRFDLAEIEAWIKATRHQPSPSVHRSDSNLPDITQIVNKAIASAKGKEYNRPNNGNQADIRVSGRRTDGDLQTRPGLVDAIYSRW